MDSATCTVSNRCYVCGAVVEEALGHSYAGGDCLTQQTCTRCGSSAGPFGDHKWTAWTNGSTYRRRTCSVCGWVDTERIGSGVSTGSSAGSTSGSTQKKVTAVRIAGKTTVLTGKKISLTASVSPSNASNKAVAWSVSNKKYATISSGGVLTARSAGAGKTVTVTATAKDGSGKKAVFNVKIKGAVSKITLKGSKSLKAGKKTTIKATVKVGKGGSKALTWSSSNKKYAKVSSKGVVKALKAGKGKTVTITAKAKDGSGKKASIKIKLK